jgi:hypothetical protein
MQSVISAAARIVVLCSAAVMAGCGGPQTGDQLKISDADQQRIGQGIKAAMKAGMYDNPMRKSKAKAKAPAQPAAPENPATPEK